MNLSKSDCLYSSPIETQITTTILVDFDKVDSGAHSGKSTYCTNQLSLCSRVKTLLF